MKTCVMHLLSSFEVGGAETVALEVGRRMDRSAFRVLSCSLTGPGPMESRFLEAGIQPLSLRRSKLMRGLDPLLVWRLAALCRRERVEVLHCHNSFPKLYGIMATRFVPGALVVATQHAIWLDGTTDKPDVLARLTNPFVTHFVAVADGVLRAGITRGDIRSDRATVIHNGVDVKRFAPLAAPAPSKGTVVVGCVARLSHEKRHALLMRAVKEVSRGCPEVRLHLVGDGALRQTLETEARRLDFADSVEFFGTRSDIPELLRSMDIFALASSTEGLPLTVLEAMASGLPVVATKVGALEEVVDHGRNGFLVPPEDPAALAAAIARLVKDQDLRRRMGQAGRQIAVERFDISAAVRKHEDLYLRLLARKRRR